MGSVFGRIGLGRMIGKMRIVEMHPEKKLVARILGQPIKSDVGDNVSGTFHLVEVGFVETAEFENGRNRSRIPDSVQSVNPKRLRRSRHRSDSRIASGQRREWAEVDSACCR